MIGVDNRGLAFRLVDVMILGLGVFALVYGASFGAIESLFGAGTAQGLTGEAATGAGYAESAFRYLPFFALAFAALALVAGAVAERRAT